MTRLISVCIEEEERIISNPSKIVKDIYESYVKYTCNLNRVVAFLLLLIYFTFGCTKAPIYLEYRKYNSSVDKPLILPISMLYDTNNYYGLTWAIGVFFAWFGGSYVMVSLCLILNMMVFISAKLNILNNLFRNYDATGENVFEEIRHLIVQHQFIIRYVDDLNKVLRQVIFVEFVLNSVNQAAVMVQFILYSHTWMDRIFWLTYAFFLLVQLLVLTWHANEIHLQSLSISYSLYESHWYEQTHKIKQIVNIVMMRSQKPLNIYIGSWYPMTLGSALVSLKTAYSYVTLIVRLDSH
ncbi:hypothetical protein GWI33_021087 [Rhynchophorus ferrugineus]|uniref:Odorant receptor n=1 Tax=Rhynchophorus ferrugineus TaxID=354439 RepID=A0A834M559_RHYFE|nr:hypothetical protein GWI33_021087 [Rhynchophorus ferrugineus]